MKMYVDLDQYLLTLSYLAPSVIVCYVVFCGLAKLLAKLTRDAFRLPFFGHVGCLILACAGAPIVALWFVDRPIDLMGGAGKSLLIGAITAFLVVAMVENAGRRMGNRTDSDSAR